MGAGVLSGANAQTRSNANEAIAHVQRAQAFLQAKGLKAAAQEFNNLKSPFNSKSSINPKGDLYIFSIDPTGTSLIHGQNKKIQGKNTLETQDADGFFLIKAMVDVCFKSKEGKGWVSYKWPNPISKQVQPKKAYLERANHPKDLCLGAGIYQ